MELPAMKNFLALYDLPTTTELVYDPKQYPNGTGYFDGIQTDPAILALPAGVYKMHTGAINDRKIIIVINQPNHTEAGGYATGRVNDTGVMVMFQRYSGGENGVIVTNNTYRLEYNQAVFSHLCAHLSKSQAPRILKYTALQMMVFLHGMYAAQTIPMF
jgi:hypothetical protein